MWLAAVDSLVVCPQVHGAVCAGVCAVLLHEEVSHVRHSADSRVLWLHSSELLRVLPHVGLCVLPRLPLLCEVHLQELEDGLTPSQLFITYITSSCLYFTLLILRSREIHDMDEQINYIVAIIMIYMIVITSSYIYNTCGQIQQVYNVMMTEKYMSQWLGQMRKTTPSDTITWLASSMALRPAVTSLVEKGLS